MLTGEGAGPAAVGLPTFSSESDLRLTAWSEICQGQRAAGAASGSDKADRGNE